jgi:hypothetical protein
MGDAWAALSGNGDERIPRRRPTASARARQSAAGNLGKRRGLTGGPGERGQRLTGRPARAHANRVDNGRVGLGHTRIDFGLTLFHKRRKGDKARTNS